MPVWSKVEIRKCRELLYPDTPENAVLDCYRRWGGIARYVLDFARVPNQQALLEEAMVSVDLDWLLGAYRKLDANDAQAHRLLHYRVNKRFSGEYVVFASEYVVQEVYQRLYWKDQWRLLEFIAVSDEDSAFAVLRGQLLEEHAHSGGTIRIRYVRDNSEAHGDEYFSEGDWDDEGDNDDMDVDGDGREYCDNEFERWCYC